jgi:hypothetical protein
MFDEVPPEHESHAANAKQSAHDRQNHDAEEHIAKLAEKLAN